MQQSDVLVPLVFEQSMSGDRAEILTPPDLTELQAFYGTPAGEWVERLVGGHVRDLWGDVSGLNVVGLGYPLPFFDAFLGQAERLSVFMPARQGVTAWPHATAGSKGNLTALINEDMLPLSDGTVDRLLMVHALEAGERTRDILREAWRCLKAEGQMIVVIPNRRGVWARLDHTPFGHGRPYSRGQLKQLLRGSLFEPEAWIDALHMPPVANRVFVRSAPVWERIGRRISPAFSGLIIVSSSKQLYAPISKGKAMRVRSGAKPVPRGAVATSCVPVRPLARAAQEKDSLLPEQILP